MARSRSAEMCSTVGNHRWLRTSILVAVGAVAILASTARPHAAVTTTSASFALAFKDEVSPYREMSAFVLPGETLALQAIGGPDGDYTVKAVAGALTPAAPHETRRWNWTAPDAPGAYELRVGGPGGGDEMVLHAFVMVPASRERQGYVNGYRIGDYPAKPLNGNTVYLPPSGFVEVTKANEDAKLSPHFRLRQFICKEDTTAEFPKYVVVKERLLLKLEAVLALVNTLGFHVDTLHVMSAYRTPFYNHAIGDVLYSMHQFGSAADVFVDKDNRGRMDDLNHDGVVDVRDSHYLYNSIERLLSETPYRQLEGGLGFYRATSAHPPFVHVDVRGTKARWQG